MSASPQQPDDGVPNTVDSFMFLSPEQYEALLEAREEQQQNLSREQVEVVLKALEATAAHPERS